jgi:hypothetical protein
MAEEDGCWYRNISSQYVISIYLMNPIERKYLVVAAKRDAEQGASNDPYMALRDVALSHK